MPYQNERVRIITRSKPEAKESALKKAILASLPVIVGGLLTMSGTVFSQLGTRQAKEVEHEFQIIDQRRVKCLETEARLYDFYDRLLLFIAAHANPEDQNEPIVINLQDSHSLGFEVNLYLTDQVKKDYNSINGTIQIINRSHYISDEASENLMNEINIALHNLTDPQYQPK